MLKVSACLYILASLGLIQGVTATTVYEDLKKIEHVVIFMQENRAFDHYLGASKGVRGFQDPNVQITDGKPVWYQPVNASLTNATDHLLPFYLPYQGEANRSAAIQCATAGSNSYAENEAAYNGGKNNMWALGNSPLALGHLRRDDIPVHYAIADEFTVGDMYQESIIAATNPNRVMLWSGSINVPGNDRFNSSMGPVVDNNDSPGCSSMEYETQWSTVDSATNYTCYPFDWKTVPEYLQDLGFSWNVYQAAENFGDNDLLHFTQYQTLAAEDPENPLVVRGLVYQPYTDDPASQIIEKDPDTQHKWAGGIDAFISDAANGTLPAVSYIVLPAELSEHPPYLPESGAWAQRRIVEAVVNSPKFSKTAMFISYDETGGWADHVTPFTPPEVAAGEWMWNPFARKSQPTGPGYRLPFFVVSPWSRGGAVFTEPADHTSQIMFLEEWARAHGKPFYTQAISEWRREHMSNLVSAFDFTKEDTSSVKLPHVAKPHTTNGFLDSAEHCAELYGDLVEPTVPYGNQTLASALVVEKGFRPTRGHITEGRHLVFEAKGRALALTDRRHVQSIGTAKPSAAKYDRPEQRLVLHSTSPNVASGHLFRISFADGGKFLTSDLKLTSDRTKSGEFRIKYTGSKEGYYVQEKTSGKYLVVHGESVTLSATAEGFKFYSVTF